MIIILKNITFQHWFLVIKACLHLFMLKNTQVDYKFGLYLVKSFQYDQATWTTNIFVTFTMGVNNRSILVYTIKNLHVQYIHEK